MSAYCAPWSPCDPFKLIQNYDVNDKSVVWNVRWRNVIVTAQQENHFVLVCWWLESDTQLQSVHFTLTSVQNVKSIPSSLWVHESQPVWHGFDLTQQSLTISSVQSISSNNQHWKFGLFNFLTQVMRTIQQLIDCFGSVSQMFVFISQIAWSANVVNFGSFLVDSFENSWVENGSFSSWVDAH